MPGSYNVIADFDTTEEAHDGYLSMDPYWVCAVIRLGTPLSFSRETLTSITKDLSLGALARAVKPLVITDDVLQLNVSGNKRSHTKSLSLTLKQTDVNYLNELLGGDWLFAWIVNNKRDYLELLDRIDKGLPCNRFKDGLKFVGRVHNVRKQVAVDPEVGVKSSTYSVQGIGFGELDTMFFYDNSLASKDVLSQDLGQWLTRLGVNYEAIFRKDIKTGVGQNNVNLIVPTLLDLIVGKGPSKTGNISVRGENGENVSATPSLANEAPFAYLVPLQAGKLLGREQGSKADRVMAYADLLELLQGVQEYSNQNDWHVFTPNLKESESKPGRRITNKAMLGTFLPAMPEFTNTPLWQIFQRYLNPTINELYTCLRVNAEGNVMPTIVMRQIPFTTDAFDPDAKSPGASSAAGDINFTKFSNLPRWVVPATMIRSVDIGRSDATRFNFVHIYGQSALLAEGNNPITRQIVQNPPIRDDLDIMRSGLRSYMTTVECWVNDQIGQVPTKWMKLVADWTIGSHLTLNGTIVSLGIQAPICEGDNLEFDGVVYHIEEVSHAAGMAGEKKRWTTTLKLTNGMRADDGGTGFTDNELGATSGQFPIYPGFISNDNTALDPGLTLERRETTGGDSIRDNSTQYQNVEPPSQLNPASDKTK